MERHVSADNGRSGCGVDRRLAGPVTRGRPVRITSDGLPVTAFEGESVAAALLAAGQPRLRVTAARGEPRGVFCGIGACFDCATTIDGTRNTRACQTPVRDGMSVQTQRGEGEWPGPGPSHEPDPPAVPRTVSWPVVVVGGGPAGIAAALEAARAGLRCAVIDEAPRLGGQIFRQPPPDFRVGDERALGKPHRRGNLLRAEFDEVADRIEVYSQTSVLSVSEGPELLCSSPTGAIRIIADQLILATGAYDRSVPFPGWTLPGVLTPGGAQTLVKTMRIRPGDRAVVAGTGPLLLAAANQLHEAGVRVLAVLEAGRPPLRPGAVAGAWREPSLIADAWEYWRGLRRAGIPYRFNHTVFQAHGEEQVRGVTYGPVRSTDWRPILERSETLDCDLLVVGFGFVPNTELSDLAGCRHRYEAELGGWVPERDPLMRTSLPNVFAVGDGAGVAGSLVAVAQGRVAGITVAEQHGAISAAEAARRRRRPLRKLRALDGVRKFLDGMSRIRPGLTALATPRTLLCRCEEVELAQVRSAMSQGAKDLQAVKLLTRLGMGPCQGRVCAPAATDALCAALECSPHQVGRINPRPPVRPVTLGALATPTSGTAGDPVAG